MPRIKYIEKNLSPARLRIASLADQIATEYARQGMDLTLRQLYYQFVARDLFPDEWIDRETGSKNSQNNYRRLMQTVNDARMIGMVDWDHITDRTRNLASLAHWDSPGQIVRACASQYRVDLWKGQEHYVEVWVEKEALAGVVDMACTELDVPYFSCRGFSSLSEMWNAARRFNRDNRLGVILHLGDHDPSGMDMTRDIIDRLNIFTTGGVFVDRIALNMDQVERYDPPPNPAKESDSRYGEYSKNYGDECWELDALDPKVLIDLIQEQVRYYIDEPTMEQRRREIQDGRDRISRIVELV